MTPINDEDLVNKFSVNEDKWYSLEIKYDYHLFNRDTDTRIFKDESFMGIYFDPTITEIYADGKINHLRNADIQDTGNITNAERVDIGEPYKVGDIDKYITTFSSNISLPDKYILDFQLSHDTKSQGGGVGFI